MLGRCKPCERPSHFRTWRVQKALSSSERQSEGVREAFRDLEERANRVAGVGTRLGDRLQVRLRDRYPTSSTWQAHVHGTRALRGGTGV